MPIDLIENTIIQLYVYDFEKLVDVRYIRLGVYTERAYLQTVP